MEIDTIVCGDCLEVMRDMPDGCVDAVITDAPYGLSDGNGKVQKRGSELVTFYAGEWDKDLPLQWIKPAIRVLIDGGWIAVFTDKLSVNTVWDVLVSYGAHPKQTFYWVKTNPPPQPRKNFASGIESAVVATKGPVKKWNGGGWCLNYNIQPLVTISERIGHPTQKPIALMEYIINAVSVPSDLVFDPFIGSGTTAVAALKLGRHFYGCDINPDYVRLANERIEKTRLELSQVEMELA